MKNTFKTLAASSLLCASGVNAEIKFQGFANIVAGTTTSSDETLYGYDDNVDFKEGSLFALQASSDLGEGLGVTAQILSKGEEDWDPDFAWAFVSYDVNDNLRILAGRQRAPFYMYSDYLDVSYAYNWITPPRGVYDLPFDTFDGLGAIYTTELGIFDTTIHAIFGSNNNEDQGSETNDIVGSSFTFNYDWLTLRTAYFQGEINIDVGTQVNTLAAGWDMAGFSGTADDLLIEEDTGVFTELGFQIDYENIIVIAEYTNLQLDDTPFGESDSYYVTGGYRFSEYTVHVTYGADESDAANISMSGVPPLGAVPALDPLILGTFAVSEAAKEESEYVTIGARWDFHPSAALKMEYTDYSNDLDSSRDAGLFRTALVTVF